MKWYLHRKDWQDGPKSGTDLYVVCPEEHISIKLDTDYGYGTRHSSFTDAVREKALAEAKDKVTRYNVNTLTMDCIMEKIVGKKLLAKPILDI